MRHFCSTPQNGCVLHAFLARMPARGYAVSIGGLSRRCAGATRINMARRIEHNFRPAGKISDTVSNPHMTVAGAMKLISEVV